jgi:hypothetical protein
VEGADDVPGQPPRRPPCRCSEATHGRHQGTDDPADGPTSRPGRRSNLRRRGFEWWRQRDAVW